jgi:hypothetical protein
VVPLGPVLAEVGAHLVQAVAAVTRFKLLPWLSGPVEEGLCDPVQYGRPGPVAGIRGQARQAEDGVGELVAGSLGAGDGLGEQRPGSGSVSSWRASVTACSPSRSAVAMSTWRAATAAVSSAVPNSSEWARASGRSSTGTSNEKASWSRDRVIQ